MIHRSPTAARLAILCMLLIFVTLLWRGSRQRSSVQVAVAKGQALFDMVTMTGDQFAPESAWRQAMDNPAVAELLAGKRVEFVNALPLSYGEAQAWRHQGCGQEECAQVTWYDHTHGGTLNAIVHLASGNVVATWDDVVVRPAGSSFVLDRAMQIAAADARVTAVLGHIGAADPAMLPMSAWLSDDDCGRDWCVDLSFHDPAGSGQIFHVFVNMTQDRVARTFYTRGRPDLDVAMPASQRRAFRNGCHQEYGWSVCWEMTAHDGLNFYDAAYRSVPIFRSIKIPQIEAWYPSWPGGYRDEIGFAATVPPFGGTEINDLEDGFEVRQLFTEFVYWPNCICCYRYEQIIRFYANGAFEPRFVSHGPGCDDLSVYRPFWRIDMILNEATNDSVQVWQQNQWVELETEQELHPFVDDVSPNGHKLVTSSGDLHYYWRMVPTDPLGVDEARFFVLRYNEGEGEGPLGTGPGDTFQPPRQWLDGESLAGQDIVLWYVPLLKTKHGDPLWCMPDPEPGINQCEAILQAAPGEAPHQPTEEELALIVPPAPTATPGPTRTPAPAPTPRPVEGETAAEIFLNAGCGACHVAGTLGAAGKVGPDLSNVGAEAGERIPGMTAEAYLRQSIVDPNAFILPDCPNGPCLANVMPANYGYRLTPQQIDTLVAFLLEQVAPPETAVRIIGENGPPTPLPQAKTAAQPPPTPQAWSLPNLAVQWLLATIVLVLSLFHLSKMREQTNEGYQDEEKA